MIEHFVRADIKLPIDTEYNIDKIAEAVTMAESEGRNGKILLNFDINASSNTEKNACTIVGENYEVYDS